MSRVLAIVAFGRLADGVGRELESEAPCGAAARTPYHMLSGIDCGMWLTYLRLTARTGGRSGNWSAE